jgi:3-dehydroquinate synthase
VQAFEFVFSPKTKRVCRIRVGHGVLDRLVQEIVEAPPAPHLILISDDNVAPLHGAPLQQRLIRQGLRVDRVEFSAGEASKSRRTKQQIEDRLFELGVGRDAAFLAVGGGVTGDLAGFIAATWHRGVPVIQVPTSLIAMADAALGGKTGLNLPGGKNLVGAFHQPLGVYADIAVLSTLPDTEYRDGFAEIVKSAVIADSALFRRLEQSAGALARRSIAEVQHVVEACMRIKGRIAIRDEREAGRRAALNFGHTVAHALEAVTSYAVPHGQAVAIGLCAESRLAVATTGFSTRGVERIDRLLDALDLPTTLPAGIDLDALIAATRRDKKSREGRARYALPLRLGRMPAAERVVVEVDESLLRGVLDGLKRPPTGQN